MDDSTSFDTLLERVIEEVRTDPAARDKLLRALLPMELLRLPEEVADIKRLLERTIQTQENMAETQKGLAETQAEMLETQDRLSATQAEILKTQAEMLETQDRLSATQAEILKTQEEIIAEQARMRATQEKLVEAVDRLTKTQQMIIAELKEVKKEQRRFAAEQSDMRKTLDAVVANQAEMQETQKRMQDDIGQLKGESLEVRLDFRLVPKLRQHLKIRKTKVIRSVARPSNGNFFDEIDDALDEEIITERQRGRVFDTDMILKGVIPQTADDLWIAIEASNAIDASDIDRAKETAQILSVVYQAAAEAVAAGYEISEAAEGYAEQNGVKVILI
ncbi:MAG: hypothetical protein OXT69_03135 [Candidatus Poribacteria bacterium]|nr:hypothetical protein [Candidatus Poribacteria bacterium]